MNIETKFDIGDKVYTLYKNRIEPCYVVGISIQVKTTLCHTGYTMTNHYDIVGIKNSSLKAIASEDILHSTPEDLFESLKNELE